MTDDIPAVLLVRERPKIAVTREEAAEMLSMSLDSWERYVQPQIRLIIRGRLRLVPVRELERWVERTAGRP